MRGCSPPGFRHCIPTTRLTVGPCHLVYACGCLVQQPLDVGGKGFFMECDLYNRLNLPHGSTRYSPQQPTKRRLPITRPRPRASRSESKRDTQKIMITTPSSSKTGSQAMLIGKECSSTISRAQEAGAAAAAPASK